jgi:large-conductance mechanosensitive channel
MGKHTILWLIAILVGIFFITEELEESVVMVKKGMELGMESNWMFLYQYAVIVLFVRVALHFTICWIPKKNFHLKQGLAVGALFLLSSIFVSICVNPVIQKVNQIILEKNRNLHIDPDFPYYKQLYFFHEPYITWLVDFLIIACVLFLLTRIFWLIINKKEIERDNLRLKNETLEIQMSALNNQINPHFFFNSLNSLHALITEGDQKRSLDYLSNLSKVFRYILQSEKKTLVLLSEELEFLETYRFMLSVKFEDKLTFQMNISEKYRVAQLPVLSLLPLVGNIIKHNEISSRNPMWVKIETNEDYLVITNPKHPKLDTVEKSGLGLQNLNNRFSLLMKESIIIQETDELFKVSLPLIIN